MIGEKLEQLADVLMENESNSKIDKEIIVYGLSSAIEHGASIITTITLGVLFGLTLESVVFLIALSFIRTYAGGYHCKKAINCYLMSSGVVALVLLIVKYVPREYTFALGMGVLLLAVPFLLKFAPAETPNKPLDEDERKHYRKKMIIHLGIECIAILVLFLLELHSIAFLVCIAVAVTSMLAFLEIKLFKITNVI